MFSMIKNRGLRLNFIYKIEIYVNSKKKKIFAFGQEKTKYPAEDSNMLQLVTLTTG